MALRRFVEAADARYALCGPAPAREIDHTGARHVVDLGGARRTALARVLHAHPHLTGTVFDLHPVRPLFDEHAARHGLTGRMRFRGGDFFTDDCRGWLAAAGLTGIQVRAFVDTESLVVGTRCPNAGRTVVEER